MAAPRFLVASLDPSAATAALGEDDAHHLTRVLRAGVGADVHVFDGRGREWAARVQTIQKRAVTVRVVREIQPAAEPPVQVTLAIGLLKGDQMDAVVRDATMLGVAAIVPLASDHVSIPPRARRSGATERWRRIAIASTQQCGRAVVPAIAPIASFNDLVERPAFDAKILCAEPRLGGETRVASARPARALVLTGPEGGWSEAEVDHALSHGAELVHFGSRVLRAERAPTVALSVLWTVWGWEKA